MTLSNKICESKYIDNFSPKEYISKENVKEFIRLLKNSFSSTKNMPKKLFMQLQVQIDNLAGKELIE
jgi:hypothetical protein